METEAMDRLVSIGDFSRMTYLSVKALRHYHDIGLLAPAAVDPSSGYRSYSSSQVAVAHVIRRFRDLGMPLEDVKAVIEAADVEARNVAIVAHLDRMERQLRDTQGAVDSLRSLLGGAPPVADVAFRAAPPVRAVLLRAEVSVDDLAGWWVDTFARLERSAGAAAGGPRGTLYTGDFFELAEGEVTAYLPIVGEPGRLDAGVEIGEVPGAEYAVAVHRGSLHDLDRTYGALGTFVNERAVGLPGPIREVYLVTYADTLDEDTHRTEVCWPVFRTAPAG
jgi:DNA-binding transcriptional MerR regulator/effector-binding domain-containing protein